MIWLILILLILFLGPVLVYLTGGARLRGDWSTASHASTGLAPDPVQVPEAVVQVYAARAFAWRGAFSVHTWVAVKPAHAERYTRYEVIGWRFYRGLSPVSASSDRAPDAQWFGANPWLLRDVRGTAAPDVKPHNFIDTHVLPFRRDHGYSNAALDKLLAAVGDWAPIGTRLRWPYRWVDEAEAERLRPIARRAFPDLFGG